MDRQKIIVLMGAAWLSAGLLTWFLYAKAVAPQTEKTLRAVVATHDMPVGTLLRDSDIKTVNYPERVLPKHAVYETRLALSRALLAPINANEPLTSDKLSSTTNVEGIAAVIRPGFRAVSVPTTDVTGVAGLIQPRSKVDVLFTRPGSMAEATTSTILQNIEVLSIGKSLQAGQAADPKAATTKSPVVTLLLNPLDAQKLELAKNQGRISLSLRNPTDASADVSTEPITTEVLDPMISARLARARRGRTTALGRANLEDPNVWQELTGEKKTIDPRKLAAEEEARRRKAEAERPKVVDVFRGDKHTQETFK
jgi:pilus assembly protein CpaB